MCKTILLRKVEKYKKLPDMAGANYDAIEEFLPRSFIKLKKNIRSFLDYIDKEKNFSDPPISALMLIAPWGLGKTTTYDLIIKEIIKENSKGFSIKIRAQEISNYYNTFNEKEEFKLLPGNADRFLYILTRLILENIDFRETFLVGKFDKSEIESISKIFNMIKNEFNFFLIFIDELEEVLRNKNSIIPFILKSIKDLLNGNSNIINPKMNPDLMHFLSFIMACTDAAMYEISRLEELEYQYGGIKRRIQEVKIDEISIMESIEYIHKLNKFSYNNQNVQSFVNRGGSYNTIARMTMKNPGLMKSLFTKLLAINGTSKLDDSGMMMPQIDGEFIIENSRDFTIEYMETQRRAINKVLYNNWMVKFKNIKNLDKIFYLFLGELRPFTLEEAGKRLKIDVSDVLRGIYFINQYINSLNPNVKEAIILVKNLDPSTTSADIQNYLRISGFSIEETEDFRTVIRFSEGEIEFEDFLEHISYYEIRSDETIKQRFLFSEERDILKQLFPYLSSTTLTILKNQFRKYILDEIDFYILNPELYNVIFPLPIPQEYNILEDTNETVRIWTEISRTKKIEIFSKEITKILSEFLILNRVLSYNELDERKPENKSSILTNLDFSYHNKILDENQFIILKNFKILQLSNKVINLIIWREIGDYSRKTISEITEVIYRFQTQESLNLHIVLLLSQSKIQEEYIQDLREILEFSIVKELTLTLFDITKYAFLYEVKTKYEGLYKDDKFVATLEKLTAPLVKLINTSKENLILKGLDLKLSNYMEKLSDIPQLMKYVLYNFNNNFSDFNKLELKKPYEMINPVGLNPNYSSSIDDISNSRLLMLFEEYLIKNDFIFIQGKAIKVKLPKIENTILNILKFYSSEGIYLTVDQVSSFFFDKSNSPSLLKAIFITDLENRGLIKVKKKHIYLINPNESELNKRFTELEVKLKTLKIRDPKFYSILTIKQRGYSLVFLDDFLNALETLLQTKKDQKFDKYFKNIRYILFIRISDIFNNIFDKIFIPLDLEIPKVLTDLKAQREKKFQINFLKTKLHQYIGKKIEIETFPEIVELENIYKSIFEKIKRPIIKRELVESAKSYYYENKQVITSSPFSFLKLSKNKLMKSNIKPYFNIIFYEMLILKQDYVKSEILKTIYSLPKIIKNIDGIYADLKNDVSKVNKKIIRKSNDNTLSYHIFAKIQELSEFDLFQSHSLLYNLEDLSKYLTDLEDEYKNLKKPLSSLIKIRKRGKAQPISLLDKIFNSESEINYFYKKSNENIAFLRKSNIFHESNEIIRLEKTFKPLKTNDFLVKINKSRSLRKLVELAKRIELFLKQEIKSHKEKQEVIINHIYNYFKNTKDIYSFKELFLSNSLNLYVRYCDTYLKNVENLSKMKYIEFKIKCDQVISILNKINEGYKAFVKNQLEGLSQNTLDLYVELLSKSGKREWYNRDEIVKVAKKINFTIKDIDMAVEELKAHNLLEDRSYIRRF